MKTLNTKILPMALAFLLVLLTIPVSAERERGKKRNSQRSNRVQRQRPQRQARQRPQRQQQRRARQRPQRQQKQRMTRQRPQRQQQRTTRQRPQRQQQRMTRQRPQRQQQRTTRQRPQRQQQRMTRQRPQRQQQRTTRQRPQRQQQRMTRQRPQRQQQRMTRQRPQRQQQRMTRRQPQRQRGMTRVNNRRVVNRVVRQAPIINNNYNIRPRRAYFPRYTQTFAPGFYSDFRVRRSFRRNRNCLFSLLALGFFATRPYNTYNYAQVGYNQPFFYGQDDAYQPVPENLLAAESTVGVGGPTEQPVANSSLIDPNVPEQVMISELSAYVDSQSKDGRFVIPDGAFGNQAWNLELAQAPAVYKIDEGKYSVVAGFEGTLGESPIPSNVALEFFMDETPEGWLVKDVWIVSANGIPRTKQFQSPVHSEVKTWSAGAVCPFSGQPMIPVSEVGAQHG